MNRNHAFSRRKQCSLVERAVRQPRFKSQPHLRMALQTWGNIILNFIICKIGNTTTFLMGLLGRLNGSEGVLFLDLFHPPRAKMAY